MIWIQTLYIIPCAQCTIELKLYQISPQLHWVTLVTFYFLMIYLGGAVQYLVKIGSLVSTVQYLENPISLLPIWIKLFSLHYHLFYIKLGEVNLNCHVSCFFYGHYSVVHFQESMLNIVYKYNLNHKVM